MSVRLGLMALLAEGESYGARLRAEFEERTGGTWPLNVGQVYTTLERLVRDGLVEPTGDPDPEGRIAYRLTPAGADELTGWWTSPVDRSSTPRDELTIKLALAVTAPGVDVHHVVQGQRTATLRHLRDLTRLKRDALDRAEGTAEGPRDAEHGLAWLLVLENLVFAAEAEVRWLDHVESVLARHRATGHRPGAPGHPARPVVPAASSTPSTSSTSSTSSTAGEGPAVREGNPT